MYLIHTFIKIFFSKYKALRSKILGEYKKRSLKRIIIWIISYIIVYQLLKYSIHLIFEHTAVEAGLNKVNPSSSLLDVTAKAASLKSKTKVIRLKKNTQYEHIFPDIFGVDIIVFFKKYEPFFYETKKNDIFRF